MEIELQRIKDNGISTTGIITADHIRKVTIEDTGRDKNHDGDLKDPGEQKVWGKTRIPCGRYQVKLRDFGSKHLEYRVKFDFHIGMLWLQDVPDYDGVLIHIGNTAMDSHGCVLIGTVITNDDCISGSTMAYAEFYKYVAPKVKDGEVWITIKDEPQN
jgi:hypothetical protein